MQQKISELRAQLDELNNALTALLEQRFELSDAIGALKRGENAPVRDRSREEEILEQVGLALHDKEKYADVAAVFETILNRSRARQENDR